MQLSRGGRISAGHAEPVKTGGYFMGVESEIFRSHLNGQIHYAIRSQVIDGSVLQFVGELWFIVQVWISNSYFDFRFPAKCPGCIFYGIPDELMGMRPPVFIHGPECSLDMDGFGYYIGRSAVAVDFAQTQDRRTCRV